MKKGIRHRRRDGRRAVWKRRRRWSLLSRLRFALPLLSIACAGVLLLLSRGRAEVGMLAVGMPMLTQLSSAQVADSSSKAPSMAPPLRLTVLETETVPAVHPQQPAASAPQILIYHTHTTEAYAQMEDDPYEASGRWRTLDNEHNIVAVGELLAEQLRDRGFSVIHDTTNHEPPKLATSYSRSEKTMRSYRQKYPSLKVFIDVHRDAYGDSETPVTDYIELGGEQVARMMFVVGTGKGATGTGFDEMPDFESNYALAESITNHLTAIDSRLVRPIRVKTGRYNQHITSQCLLVEVGHNCNTLPQAMAAVPYLAEAIAAALHAAQNASTDDLSRVDVSVWAPLTS